MPYIENRIVHDADAHIMELPNWFDGYASDKVQKAFRDRFQGNKGLAQTYFENIDKVHQDKSYQEKNHEELMIRKNYDALGSFNKEDHWIKITINIKKPDGFAVNIQLSPSPYFEKLFEGS